MLDEKELRQNKANYKQLFDQILKYDEQLLSYLNEKQQLNTKLVNAVKNYFSYKLQLSNINLNSLAVSFNASHYDLEIVNNVYMLREYLRYYENANSLYFQNHQTIKENYEIAKQLFSFAWIFKGKATKTQVINAANILVDIKNAMYFEKINYYINSYKEIDVQNAIKDFINNEQEYCTLINQYCGTKLYIKDDPAEPDFSLFTKLIKVTDAQKKKLDIISYAIDGLKEKVKKKALVCADYKAISLLDTIDVDELKRNIKGLRVNALKEGGYHTIKDILRVKPWQLSSLYGISEEKAYEITHEANEIKDKTRSSISLKFDNQKKAEEDTLLLKEIIAYTDHLELINGYDTITKKFATSYHLNIQFNGYSQNDWYYLTYEQKEKMISLFEYMNSDTHHSYINYVEDLYQKWISIENSVRSDQEIWNYYEQNAASIYSILDQLVPGLFGSGDAFYGLPKELAEEIKEECFFPDGLLTTLRTYQEWGVKYILHQKNVLLGDEMGLGKTLQAIATMVSLRNTGANHFLVVCPAAVLVNWRREVSKHSKLRAIKVHGSSRNAEFKRWIRFGGVCVTTYETTKYLELKDDFKYDLLVVDEAHYIKNVNTQRTKNIIEIAKKTDRHLYMTGTALENNVDEMISLINQLNPGIAQIAERYKYMGASKTFRDKIAGVYYRRKVKDVQKELPDLIEEEAWVSLTSEEDRIYKRDLYSKSYSAIRKVSWNVDDLKDSSKANRLKDIIENAKEEGRKVIVFSFFRNTIEKIYDFLNGICLPPINGSISPQRRQEILDQFNDSKPGSVLISQIQAGGTGLNIQCASVVVIAEPQLKPSIENQAIARAYRMGQTSNVLVYKLLCENTIEEKMLERLKQKQEIFDAFADKSSAADAQNQNEISDKTFREIVEEEIDRINKEKGIVQEESD